jgi:hypothetical protein
MPLALRQARILRFSVGITLAMALALGAAWPMSFITPVFVAIFLSAPAAAPSLRTGLMQILAMACGCGVGLLITMTVLPYPLICLPVILLALFRLYYWGFGGGNPFVLLMMLIGLLMIPVMGMESSGLAMMIALGLSFGGALAVGLTALCFVLVPDPPSELAVAPAAAPQLDPDQRFKMAATTTAIVALPVVIFYLYGLTSNLLVLVFIALLSMQPQVGKGIKGGAFLILANAFGGLVAIIWYELLVIAPTYATLIMLSWLFGLWFGAGVFSANAKQAAFFGGALGTVLVLVGGSTGAYSDEADIKFIVRIAQIMAAAIYCISAFVVVHVLTTRKIENETDPPPAVPAPSTS